MSRWSFVIVAVLLSIGLYSSNAKSKAEFETAFKQSNRDKETPAGKRYTREFENKIFLAVASQSMETCARRSRDTVEPAMLVFIISADGKIRRVLSTPGIQYGECIVSRLRLPIRCRGRRTTISRWHSGSRIIVTRKARRRQDRDRGWVASRAVRAAGKKLKRSTSATD